MVVCYLRMCVHVRSLLLWMYVREWLRVCVCVFMCKCALALVSACVHITFNSNAHHCSWGISANLKLTPSSHVSQLVQTHGHMNFLIDQDKRTSSVMEYTVQSSVLFRNDKARGMAAIDSVWSAGTQGVYIDDAVSVCAFICVCVREQMCGLLRKSITSTHTSTHARTSMYFTCT